MITMPPKNNKGKTAGLHIMSVSGGWLPMMCTTAVCQYFPDVAHTPCKQLTVSCVHPDVHMCPPPRDACAMYLARFGSLPSTSPTVRFHADERMHMHVKTKPDDPHTQRHTTVRSVLPCCAAGYGAPAGFGVRSCPVTHPTSLWRACMSLMALSLEGGTKKTRS